MAFEATRSGDPERGPLIRLNRDEAALRLVSDGELVWLYGPRRHELATIEIDDDVPRGGVVLRDVPGVAVSEIVRIVKPDLDRMDRGRNV
jgi:hypothetical protein